MNKKLLGIALLSASALTFSACSSDDDDDDVLGGVVDEVTDVTDEVTDEVTDVTDEVTDEVTDVTDEVTDEVTDVTDEVTDVTDNPTGDLPLDPVTGLTPQGFMPGTIQAAIEATGNVDGLNALRTAGFDQSLQTNTWTVFLPTDEALAAFGAAPDLQKHIVTTGAFSAADVTGIIGSDPSGITGNDGTALLFGGGGDAAVTVNGIDIVIVDVMQAGESGIVHFIDGVIQ